VTGRGCELETLVEEPGGKKSKKKIERGEHGKIILKLIL
jgi:hypothetical protein